MKYAAPPPPNFLKRILSLYSLPQAKKRGAPANALRPILHNRGLRYIKAVLLPKKQIQPLFLKQALKRFAKTVNRVLYKRLLLGGVLLFCLPVLAITNHYERLGVPQTATPEKIRAAFLNLKNSLMEESRKRRIRIQEINAIYGILSDPEKRAEYDQTLPAPPSPTTISEEIFRDLFAAIKDENLELYSDLFLDLAENEETAEFTNLLSLTDESGNNIFHIMASVSPESPAYLFFQKEIRNLLIFLTLPDRTHVKPHYISLGGLPYSEMSQDLQSSQGSMSIEAVMQNFLNVKNANDKTPLEIALNNQNQRTSHTLKQFSEILNRVSGTIQAGTVSREAPPSIFENPPSALVEYFFPSLIGGGAAFIVPFFGMLFLYGIGNGKGTATDSDMISVSVALGAAGFLATLLSITTQRNKQKEELRLVAKTKKRKRMREELRLAEEKAEEERARAKAALCRQAVIKVELLSI